MWMITGLTWKNLHVCLCLVFRSFDSSLLRRFSEVCRLKREREREKKWKKSVGEAKPKIEKSYTSWKITSSKFVFALSKRQCKNNICKYAKRVNEPHHTPKIDLRKKNPGKLILQAFFMKVLTDYRTEPHPISKKILNENFFFRFCFK